jgi:hypothetical protein
MKWYLFILITGRYWDLCIELLFLSLLFLVVLVVNFNIGSNEKDVNSQKWTWVLRISWHCQQYAQRLHTYYQTMETRDYAQQRQSVYNEWLFYVQLIYNVSPFEYLSHNCTFVCVLRLQGVTLTSTVFRFGMVEWEFCLKLFWGIVLQGAKY